MNTKKYKKIISIVMLIVIMATTFSMNAFAMDGNLPAQNVETYKFESGHLTVLDTYLGDGLISPRLNKYIKTVTIEQGVDRLVGTFQGCYNLTSVNYIPDSVTAIGNKAFAKCTYLTSIDIPDSVTEIGNGAFMGCSKLKSITIPDSVDNIGEKAFDSCTSLKSITIPGSVESINNYTFNNCLSIEDINIKEGVKNIYANAFQNCKKLKSVTFPKSMEEISKGAFTGCTNLQNVYIYKETKFSKDAFPQDTVINRIDPYKYVGVCGDNLTYKFKTNGELHIYGVGKIERSPWNGYSSEIKSIKIHEGVTDTGDKTFANLKNLENVEIPDSLERIGECTFYGCTNLGDVSLPNSNIYHIHRGEDAFTGCKMSNVTYRE